jgi:hypothetical protein
MRFLLLIAVLLVLSSHAYNLRAIEVNVVDFYKEDDNRIQVMTTESLKRAKARMMTRSPNPQNQEDVEKERAKEKEDLVLETRRRIRTNPKSTIPIKRIRTNPNPKRRTIPIKSLLMIKTNQKTRKREYSDKRNESSGKEQRGSHSCKEYIVILVACNQSECMYGFILRNGCQAVTIR